MDMNNVEQIMSFLKTINKNLNNACSEVKDRSFETAINMYIDCYTRAEAITSQEEEVVNEKNKIMSIAAYNAGVCYLELKNPLEAVKYCKKAAELNPHNGDYNYNTALASFKIYETDDAILYAKKAIQIMPNDTQAKKLIEILDKCTRINPILLELANYERCN